MMIEYSRALYDRGFGQRISTDAEGVGAYRAFLARVNIPKPAKGTGKEIATAADVADAAGAVNTVLTGEDIKAQPDVARNVVVKITAVAAGTVVAGNVVIKGTDLSGAEVTETLSVTAGEANKTVTGAHAFKTVTSVTVPKQTKDGTTLAKVDAGYGDVLGIPYKLTDTGFLIFATHGGVKDHDSTGGTLVKDEVLSKNTYAPEKTLNGTADIDLYIIV